MIVLEQNIKGLCDKFGLDYVAFLADFNIDHPNELSVYDLEAIAEEYELDVYALLFKPVFKSNVLAKKIEQIKLLVLDVDGVMTDGGMYFTENGDQIKKYNTKDGMAIMRLTSDDFKIAIISSGFSNGMVERRAEMLKIQHCHVTREKKIDVLKSILEKEGLELKNVAIIGDDINDLEVMRNVGFSACPSDAVQVVKANVDLILQQKGGQACVREFIDNYLLNNPID